MRWSLYESAPAAAWIGIELYNAPLSRPGPGTQRREAALHRQSDSTKANMTWLRYRHSRGAAANRCAPRAKRKTTSRIGRRRCNRRRPFRSDSGGKAAYSASRRRPSRPHREFLVCDAPAVHKTCSRSPSAQRGGENYARHVDPRISDYAGKRGNCWEANAR